jgi:hypothetical protein
LGARFGGLALQSVVGLLGALIYKERVKDPNERNRREGWHYGDISARLDISKGDDRTG